ncbi:uncharacterized protein L969DRAFT_91655 [Mixia osmundae IAM 14324]|uniref:uncharacterized protein n=1 Tax=Mixia osmundae (strain CBS 9802 / IAM 14324 / JCM 22182 / KY 12970) TaxID=764103 RepID=UPI0004A5556E|nr:uncharacterized protein L969DRAFT_91655 [Mixia osmundae IAM 14324]KEI42194.1 hypothetical protein L969DRAFT_91655 [Mixia osmundae IAM 14324]
MISSTLTLRDRLDHESPQRHRRTPRRQVDFLSRVSTRLCPRSTFNISFAFRFSVSGLASSPEHVHPNEHTPLFYASKKTSAVFILGQRHNTSLPPHLTSQTSHHHVQASLRRRCPCGLRARHPRTSCDQHALTHQRSARFDHLQRAVLPGADTSASPLETFPTQTAAGSYTWNVDLPSGTYISLALRDGTGALSYSAPVTIGGNASASSSATSAAATSSASYICRNHKRWHGRQHDRFWLEPHHFLLIYLWRVSHGQHRVRPDPHRWHRVCSHGIDTHSHTPVDIPHPPGRRQTSNACRQQQR